MLKIRDGVDLKELEKFGFKKEYDIILKNVLSGYVKYSTKVYIDRTISPCNANFSYLDYEIIYDLIKADLVEKVDG